MKAHGRSSVGSDPLVIVRTSANRQEIIALCDEAHRFGIRIGMTLAQARALCAHVQHFEHEPSRDAVALEALARWMMQFSPVIAISQGEPGIFLDLTGCERVFGGLENLLQQISIALKRFRIRAHLAVAPNPGAAWAVASQAGPSSGLSPSKSGPGRIINDSDIINALENLPPIALRIPSELALSLHHLGIDTIGRLMRLPRETLPSRFGNELLLRLDQALGRISEPLVLLEHFTSIQARMDFDGPIDSLEAIWIVFKRLISKIVTDLLKRGHGARELDIEFFRPYAITLRKTIRLSRPSREPGNLFNLLRCAMETLETDIGFLGIRLTVVRSQRISDEQIQLLKNEEFIADTELSHLSERLCIRLGDGIIAQPQLVESHVPEKAYSWHGFSTRAEHPTRVENPCHVRPLHLLQCPELIGVIVTPSEDRDGRPVSFSWHRNVHRLPHSTGPERIAGEWWEGHHRTRDYFDVEDADGRRFWIFRVMETGHWFVHGEFE
jgi:protein ImuB